MTVFNLTLSILNEWRQRRRRWPDLADDAEWPFVSVTLAAYNEDKVIARTLDALRASDYPASRLEVIAVNDGSTDTTLDILNNYDWPQLRVLDQPNGGKSTALNNAAKRADPRSTVIITMDGDTLFRGPPSATWPATSSGPSTTPDRWVWSQGMSRWVTVATY